MVPPWCIFPSFVCMCVYLLLKQLNFTAAWTKTSKLLNWIVPPILQINWNKTMFSHSKLLLECSTFCNYKSSSLVFRIFHYQFNCLFSHTLHVSRTSDCLNVCSTISIPNLLRYDNSVCYGTLILSLACLNSMLRILIKIIGWNN